MIESNFEAKFKQQQKGHLDVFEEKFPLIKFPEDLKVTKKNGMANFVVEKEGAPNEVSVIVYTGATVDDKLNPAWEVIAFKGSKFYGDSLEHVSIDDTDDLLRAIETNLFYDPNSEDRFTNVEEDPEPENS